jgi:hypothetical protein
VQSLDGFNSQSQRAERSIAAVSRPVDQERWPKWQRAMSELHGDEFVCAMSNLSAFEAGQRFVKIDEALRAVDAEHLITFGMAEALPTDSLEALIARADAELLEARRPR